MLASLSFVAFIKAVLSSPIIFAHALDSAPLEVLVRSIAEQCTITTNARSLYDILRSCAATTFACTWVSMHRNVPSPGKSKGRLLLERVLLCSYAVVAPECVTIWAYRQYLGAARHVREYNARFKCESPISWVHRHHLISSKIYSNACQISKPIPVPSTMAFLPTR